ncbi:MAG: hemerythrin domain-containing protein [Sciscionella sp.]
MPEDESAVDGDVIEVLMQDHRDLERAFDDIERGGLSPRQRRDLIDYVITELVRHAVAAEQHVYPIVRASAEAGDDLADRAIAAHNRSEEIMKQLEDLAPDDPEFDRLVATLSQRFGRHVTTAEGELFPRLRQACSLVQLRGLGYKVSTAKSSAPTRPHPTSPDKPPANLLVDPGVGLVDRLRDALAGD